MYIRRKIWIFLFFAGAIVGSLVFTLAVRRSDVTQVTVTNEPHAEIPLSSEYNERQSVNACGAFSVAAVLRTRNTKDISPDDLAETISWKIPRLGVHPRGLEKEFTDRGLEIETPNLESQSNDQKIEALRGWLRVEQPIILLVKQQEYQHYFVLLGFDRKEDVFYIYDPLHEKGDVEGLTKDDNGDLPGNRSIASDQLIEQWSQGGMFGMYEWYALVVE